MLLLNLKQQQLIMSLNPLENTSRNNLNINHYKTRNSLNLRNKYATRTQTTTSRNASITSLFLKLLVATAVFASVLLPFASGAPVEESLQDKVEADEDMLLLLVPSVPIEKRSAQDQKDKVRGYSYALS